MRIFFILHTVFTDPCNPSPCGQNSLCHVSNDHVAVCSCQIGMVGTPPFCKPECVVSSECSLQQACLNNKCRDPCPGTCGRNAKCQVVNHNPICTCQRDYSGDPFVVCTKIVVNDVIIPRNPCDPNPCGPNSECRVINDSPACSCVKNYIGKPPSCRPECVINTECPSNKACITQKCQDPCPGSCGSNAKCNVINHTPSCTCIEGYSGDPFIGCNIARQGRCYFIFI